MKTTTEKIYAYLLQKYEWNTELVAKHLVSNGFEAASDSVVFWGAFIAAGAERYGKRLAWRDCGGNSDLGSGWGG